MSQLKIAQISAGTGPAECCWAVGKFQNKFLKALSKNGIEAKLLNAVKAKNGVGFSSLLYALKGPDIAKFSKNWEGSILWIAKSPFRPNHKRKNWYINVSFFNINQQEKIKEHDIKYQVFRSSGPGGQHVNKTSTAIHAIHIPSKIMAISQDSRSQLQNKTIAKQRLIEKFMVLNIQAELQTKEERWLKHYQLQRGSPIKCFKGR